MTTAIEAIGLTKRYGDFTAVDGLTLEVNEGEIFGFLGPNGAGKTTSILMFLGLTEPSAGTARIYGHDCTRNPLEVKRIVSYLPETLGFYGDLSARENLLYTASLNGIGRGEALKRIDEALELAGLTARVAEPVSQFSRGMRQRLGIADVLIKKPRVAILDEPTLGLDPATIPEILALITRLSREQGMTVLLSSHQLHHVQRICNRVGIMSQGRLVGQGTIEELGQQVAKGGDIVVELEVGHISQGLHEALRATHGVKQVSARGNVLTVECSREARPRLAEAATQHGDGLLSLRSTESVLEEIYLRYFQEG